MPTQEVSGDKWRVRVHAIRLAAAYFLITVMWILGSDHLAALLATSQAQLHYIQNIKGVLFVSVMTLLVGISAARLASAEAAHQRAVMFANIDPVTRLPNTRAFYAAIASALAEEEHESCVLLLDIRDFARINATFDRQAGDQALFNIGRRLRTLADSKTLVARLEEDTFALLLKDTTPHDAGLFADRIIDRFRQEMRVAGESVPFNVNIGYASSIDHDGHVASLLDSAELALRKSKEAGHNVAKRFSRELLHDRREHFHLETELRHALADNSLEVFLQPQYELASGRLVSAEALLRWTHRERGPISPSVFIPVAEHSGLIDHIGEYVLRKVCSTLHEWRAAGLPALRVAMNIGGRQLDDQRFGLFIVEAAREWNVPLSSLEVEITETMAMNNPERALEVLDHLRSIGVSITLDDFGTGYSSLSYLLQLPVDNLKIDRSFIAGLETDRRQLVFVRTLVTLGRDLGIGVVAEGIETEAQRDQLRDLGCNLGQGYLLGRPMDTGAFRELLRDSHGTTGS